ncbi:MAG: tRNA epoxyqueuosine(34) reductase QueG [Bdellovibrionales bacterium]|nr:tRNA epoxyqueuosine(34) reductase QueG [Bdellovibrionales bacterium]
MTPFTPQQLSSWGVADWGYTELLEPQSIDHLKTWVARGDAASISYMQDHRLELRTQIPDHLLAGGQSALVFLFPYYTKLWQTSHSKLNISAMAVGFGGEDYHFPIKQQLDQIALQIKNPHPTINYRACVDTAPLMERDLAFRAGLGFFGKNSMLISRRAGSFTIIGSLLLDQKLDLRIRTSDRDHCGHCRRCVDACPTNAINSDRTINSNRCISYYTTHLFSEADPPDGLVKGEFLYGCDLCQLACPWNRTETTDPKDKLPGPENQTLHNFFFQRPVSEVVAELQTMSNRRFRRIFAQTSLERVGRLGVLKNLIQVDE